jgi:hypothetical protein
MDFDDTEILPLNLDWEDPMPKEIVAGGESRIVKETLSDKRSESMARKSGVCLQAVSQVLTEQINISEDEELEAGTAHMILWQSVKDFKTSFYLALSGRYRQANIIRRSALELAGYGVYFEENQDSEEEFENWTGKNDGKNKRGPGISEVKSELKSTLSDLMDDAERAEYFKNNVFEDRRTDLHKHVHSFVGGEIEDFVDEENKEDFPTHPWSSYFDYDRFKEWYLNFVSDMYLLFVLEHNYWKMTDETHNRLHIVETVKDLADEGQTLDKDGNTINL